MYSEYIEIDYPDSLESFSQELKRYKPIDMIEFCTEYFECLQKGIPLRSKDLSGLKKFHLTPEDEEVVKRLKIPSEDLVRVSNRRKIKSHDEIGAIYNGIRTMQINILNNLTDMLSLQKDKIKAEQDVKNKEKQICRLSEENNKDALTSVGSKSAYAHKVEELNSKMSDGNAEFAIVMVDMNNLKRVNDEFGHKSGDRYIIGCCKMICDAFKHSPVYRIGGDEFVVVAEGSDYCERYRILDDLKKSFAKSYEQDDRDLYLRYSASLGIAENRSDDTTVELVFRRADKAMYEDKKQFKKQHGSYR